MFPNSEKCTHAYRPKIFFSTFSSNFQEKTFKCRSSSSPKIDFSGTVENRFYMGDY